MFIILSELKDLEFIVIRLNVRRGRWIRLIFNSFLYFIFIDFLEDICMFIRICMNIVIYCLYCKFFLIFFIENVGFE